VTRAGLRRHVTNREISLMSSYDDVDSLQQFTLKP